MRLIHLILIFTFAFCSPVAAEDWVPSNTTGVVVGALEWKKGLDSFSNKHRKDKELHALLTARGANLGLLIDSQATKAAILQEVKERAKAAAPGSTFFFYYAGHGIKDGNAAYMANYEIDPDAPKNTGIRIEDLAPILEKDFRGSTIIFMGDFCYSGSFKTVAESLSKKGKKTAFLTSSLSSNESTGNWTFSQTIIDCISGNALCDIDKNGSIDFSEMEKETARAMKYRERQLHGFGSFGVSKALTFAKAKTPDGTGSRRGEYVNAPYQNKNQIARIIGESGSNLTCEFYFYSDKARQEIPASKVQALKFESVPIGTKTSVVWGGKWYPARVLKVDDGFHLITYEGYDSSWDEWVTTDRMMRPGIVMVEWDGKWYPAKIQKKEPNRYFIRYEGYGSEWDEWVGPDRIRLN